MTIARTAYDALPAALVDEGEEGVRALAGMGLTFLTVHAYPQTMRAAVAGRAGQAVTLLRHAHSRGPAAARNAGTSAAVASGAEVVVYLDADVLPLPGWLDILLARQASWGHVVRDADGAPRMAEA